MIHRLGGCAAALLVAGCTVGPLPVEGTRCPCGSGAVCDPCTQQCVAEGQPLSSCGNDPSAAIQVSNLRAEWATPNMILWRWDLADSNDPDQLGGFRLVVGESEQDVVDESGSARVFSATDNPELARYFLPRANGEDRVLMTLSDGHDPSSLYFARLVASDSLARVSSTEVAQKRTQDPSVRAPIVIFDEPPAALSLPAEYALKMGGAYAGEYCFEWQAVNCQDCFENLRHYELAMQLDPLISVGGFSTTAYIEFSVEVDGEVPSYWSDVRLKFGPTAAPNNGTTGGFRGYTIRTTTDVPGYRTYQVPLRALAADGGLLQYAALADPLQEVSIGGGWDAGASVRIDAVRIFH
jgi:hypothetical protein